MSFESIKYFVSIQWGKGPHYFICSEIENKSEALLLADSHVRRLKNREHERGAKPSVRVLSTICIVRDINKEA